MQFFYWLFNEPAGVAVLVFGGMVLFVIIALIAEHRTHKMFYNHEPEEDERRRRLGRRGRGRRLAALRPSSPQALKPPGLQVSRGSHRLGEA